MPDIGVLKTYAPVKTSLGRSLAFSNGCSANERHGCTGNWTRLGFHAHDPDAEPGLWVSTFVNNRADRTARSQVFGRVLVFDTAVDRHVLVSSNVTGLVGYYEEALEILNAVDAVEARIREGSGTVAGHLKINAPNSFGQMVIAPLLPKFIEAHPDIILSLSLDDRLIDMVEGGFDLSIRIRSSLPDSSLIVRRIGAVRQRIFASPGYLERAGCPEAPQDLLKHRIIGFLLANHLTAWHLHGPGGSFDIDLRPQVRVGSSLVLRDLLIAGQGIGTLPDFVSNGPEDRGELVRVLPDYELPPPQIFAITAPQMGADGRVRAFLGYLQSALEGSTLQPA